MEREKELLANYIDDVLYHPERASLDLSALTDDGRSLGKKLQKIQSVLLHMTEQIERIVQRDGKKIPHDGVSDTRFDQMIRELMKRTTALENERNLFIQFTESASERIIVLDEENGDLLFGNRVAREYLRRTKEYVDDANSLNTQSGCSFQNPYSNWLHTVIHPGEGGEPVTEYFQVHSIYIIWENRGAIAHMFSDVTELQRVQRLASRDFLTETFNRGYAMEYLERIFSEGKEFSLGFVDVDYLKYCNDTFGHSAGDDYLLQVAGLLQGLGPEAVACRTGGDEFLVIVEAWSEQQLTQALDRARRELFQECFKDSSVHKSFSYGVASYSRDSHMDLQRLLSIADERMYQNKLDNKLMNHLQSQDDRLVN